MRRTVLALLATTGSGVYPECPDQPEGCPGTAVERAAAARSRARQIDLNRPWPSVRDDIVRACGLRVQHSTSHCASKCPRMHTAASTLSRNWSHLICHSCDCLQALTTSITLTAVSWSLETLTRPTRHLGLWACTQSTIWARTSSTRPSAIWVPVAPGAPATCRVPLMSATSSLVPEPPSSWPGAVAKGACRTRGHISLSFLCPSALCFMSSGSNRSAESC